MSQHDYVIENASGATLRADLNAALEAAATTNKGTARPATAYPGEHWIDENTPSATVWTESVFDGTDDVPTMRVDTTANRAIPFNAAHGQCRLAKDGSNLKLSPCNGNVLVINGAPEVVPAAGVTLAPTGLTPGTVYYVYASMSGTTMTLEASTTGRATDAATGVEVKAGDATRTLVGLARCNTGPSWTDTDGQRLVASYFNRRNVAARRNFTANRSTSSGTYVELNTEMRAEFVTWGDEAVAAAVTGAVSQTTANPAVSAIQLDGATNEDGFSYSNFTAANQTAGVALTQTKTLAEGYHYYTAVGKVLNTGTGTWIGGAAGTTDVTTLQIMVRG